MRSWSFLWDYAIYVNMSAGTFYKLLVFYDLISLVFIKESNV